MLEVITSALKRGDEVRLVGIRQFLRDPPQGLDRTQPAHRRADADQGEQQPKFRPGKILKDAVQ